MTDGVGDRASWAAEVVQEIQRYFSDGRASLLNPQAELLDVAVRDGRFWLATRHSSFASPIGLVRKVTIMSTGFVPPLDPESAAEILVGEVATPPEVGHLTVLDGVGWWGELP